ncbi:enhancer of mRNA-decapping protein 4-like [Leptidea sinapis]|nr:enhancer of mRNA-decapping protein 4-like [Leptidea sinapis]
MLLKLSDTTQRIVFSEDDDVCSEEVYASDVVVTTNPGNHNHGSSRVKLTNLVDYNWEVKFYPGRLIDVHCSGKYLAYILKAPSSSDGMVRVVYMEPGVNERILIKGMKGEVQDLAFAFIKNQVLLASIDELGNIFVHEIEFVDGKLRYSLVVEIHDNTGMGGSAHLVAWCPYIPDDEDDASDDDVAKMLLTTHSNVARIWNIGEVSGLCSGGAVKARDMLTCGAGRAAGTHCGPLRAASFSPDGTALATAAADGYVMFAQVYVNSQTSPRCLHKWQPHEGKPLTCLFFLDNHKNYNSDVQFWKFAVTGADNNTNIKIWSCKSWSCIQSIVFSCPIVDSTLMMKASLDISANYLLLSDYKSRSLYVLKMTRDEDDTIAYCKSVSEFLLPYQVLGFCIVDAEEMQPNCESRCDDPFHRNGSANERDEPHHFELHEKELGCGTSVTEESVASRSRVRLCVVQPKGLQQAELTYTHPRRPAHLHDDDDGLALEGPVEDEMPANILQQQTQQLKNLLLRSQAQSSSLLTRAESPPAQPQLNLMTPDAFSSPGKRDEELDIAGTQDLNPRLSTTGCDEDEECEVVVCDGDDAVVIDEQTSDEGGGRECAKQSGGSSPSREVQQIMSHNDLYKQTDEEGSVSGGSTGAEVYESQPCVSSTASAAAPLAAATVPSALVLTGAGTGAVAGTETAWPQISLAQITEANQRKASTQLALDDWARHKLDALDAKIEKLNEVVAAQSHELWSLRSEWRPTRDTIERALDDHQQRTTAAVESALSSGWERIARVGEAASVAAAQAAGAGAARALEPLATALQHELASKLAATDSLLRENIDKLVTSKTVMERLSTAIATSLSEMVQQSFRDVLLDSVLPLMEKAHAQIFRQINHAFQSGTEEFAANTQAAARAAAERGGAAAAASLKASLDKHAEALQQAALLQPQHFTAALQQAAHSVLEKEMVWWREQARGVVQMSRAHSPARPASAAAERQMQVADIQSMISSGDVNAAFQAALSASDLSLVIAACRAAEPARVFGPPCRLRQHVLLSLAQQLAADIATDTRLKHRYLEEAIMNLDSSNPVTREHLPIVMQHLQKQIMTFLSANPGHELSRQFRMLLMATEALVVKTK